MNEKIRPLFWEKYALNQLNKSEWESLCDGCGICCLIKLADEDEVSSSNNVLYTNVSCQLLDCSTGFCSNYPQRKTYVTDCVQLTYDMLADIYWLPKTCAYRLLYENKALPSWHPLITGSHQSVKRSGHSVAGRCVSEKLVNDEDLEDHLIKWVKI